MRLLSASWLAMRYCGGKRLLDAVFGREPIVLMYHRFSRTARIGAVAAQDFEQQLAYLSRNCNVITMKQLQDGLQRRVAWAPSTVVITIDDGYLDAFDVAFPLLSRYRVPATIFVSTDFISRRFWYWQDKLRHILSSVQTGEVSWSVAGDLKTFPLGTAEHRWKAWSDLADECYAATAEQRENMILALASGAGIELPNEAPAGYEPLDWAQLKTMSEHGVEVGSHGVSHQRLTTLSPETLDYELAASKQAIESNLGSDVAYFAYPFGGADAHSHEVRCAVERAEYQLGCVAFFDTHLFDNLMAVRRFGVGADHWDFLKAVDGLKRARCLQRAGVDLSCETRDLH